ncbi:MAG: hypothetical protein ACFE8M_12950 [Candidatus Hermodarchaeota archaeon]
MVISFYFYWNWIYSVWGWLFFILPVVAYIFLIIGCSELKKDDRKFESVKFLSIVGIILLTWSIVYRFLPAVMFSYTLPDYIIGLSYYLTVMSINYSLHIVFGIAFIKFGSKNKEHKGSLSLAAGILLTTAWASLLTLSILLIFLGFPPVMYLVIQWIIGTLFLVAAILILVNTILIKRVFMIIFAAILLSYFTFNLLDIANII